MKCKDTFLFAIVSLFLSISSLAEERAFTNTQGKQIIAEVEAVRSGQVHLKMNGKRFQVPFASLSEDDQTYLREWVENNFDFKFIFKTDEVENTEARRSENNGKNKSKSSSWCYNVTMQNRSGIKAENLTVKFLYFVRETYISDPTYGKKSKTETPKVLRGEVEFASIDNSRERTFSSDWWTANSKEWQRSKTRTVTDSDGRLYTETYWDNYESSSELDGIWVRVYQKDRMIAEYKSEGKVIKDAVWK